MTSRDFCFWLQGLFEIGKVDKLDADQVKIVREHLGWVFEHEIALPKPAEAKGRPLAEIMEDLDRDTRDRPRPPWVTKRTPMIC